MDAWAEFIEPALLHLQHPPITGLAGALLSLRFAPSNSPGDLVFSFFCGLACALFLAPSMIALLNLYSAPGQLAFAFVVGLLSPNLVIKAMGWVRDTDLWSIVWTVLDAVRGVRK